jgi:hypothetical protein
MCLETLAAHHLDQNRELQLAAADDFDLLRRVGRLETDRHVAQQLLVESILQLARGDVLAVAAGHRRGIDAEDHRHGRLVDRNRRDRDLVLHVGDRLADRDVLDAGEADDVARRGLLNIHTPQAVKCIQLGDLGVLHSGIELHDRHRIADLHAAVENPADRNPAEVVARVEVGDEQLQRRVRISARRRDVLDDRVEQRTQILAVPLLIVRRGPNPGVRVQHREIELVFVGVEIDEQVVNLVQHFLRARVGPVDLVDDDNRREPSLERLAQDEARLRERTLGGVHEQHDAVDHRQRALHFPAEVSVARCIDDIDQDVFVMDGGVLRQNRDAPLALQLVAVHRTLGHALVGAERAALVQQGVDERRLAMIDVGDDCDVTAQRIGDVGAAGH